MQPRSRRRLSLASWALGLGLVALIDGCASPRPLIPPDTAVCTEASFAASAACPAGDSRTPACIDAALRAAVACRPRRA